MPAEQTPSQWYERVDWIRVAQVAGALRLYKLLRVRGKGIRFLRQQVIDLERAENGLDLFTGIAVACVAHSIAPTWADAAGLSDPRVD